MWSFDLIIHALHALVGIVIVLTIFHAVVGRNKYAFMAAITGFVMVSVFGQSHITMLFGEYPVLGGSLYIPILFGLMSLCAFEMEYTRARSIMLSVLALLAVMAFASMYEAVHAALPPNGSVIGYALRMENVTELFTMGVIIYCFMNTRIALTNAGLWTTRFWRYTYVLTALVLATIIQLVTFQLDFVMANPEIIVYSISSRLFVSSMVGVTYAFRQ